MVEETIQAVLKAEEKADEIVREARRKGEGMAEDAKKEAEELKADILASARAEGESILSQSQEAAARLEQETLVKIEKEVRELKDRARGNMGQAEKLVISSLA